jgi:serine/threonine protein kinase
LQPLAVALAAGTRLGPYEITGQIGAGGMGEVYRATDTNLKRTVAIKVSPEAVATDGECLVRFQREAECSPGSIIRTSLPFTGWRIATAPRPRHRVIE